MSSKAAKGKGAGAKAASEDDREDSLQAVVLADSFETKLRPFTLERPRCLLPLANIPLIEYTLEFLANAGVEEVFLYCRAHTEHIEEYIGASKWNVKASTSPFQKLEIIRSTSRSTGDAMRDLDARNLITGDFVIVSGDVVSNFPLESALAKHRARREKDKNAIMTMILREAGSSHRSKPKSVAPVFVINPEKDRVLHYEEMRPKQESRYINLDPDLLSEQEEIDVRSDLIDCYIDICTPDVLALWTDSFDYESPRKHFLFGVLKDYELNGKTIHTHIVKDHYAARVQNLQTYDAISKDVISRWAYPLCPESNLLQGQKYELQRGNIYEEDGVVLARSCKIKRRTVIGRDTSVGDGSVISNSVLGRRCQIGKNVSIDGAYVWDDVIIGDDSVVTRAIIANESAIGRRCTIEPGSLVSFKVRISDDTILSKHSRVTTAKRKGEDNDEEKSVRSDVALVGNQGEGYRFEESEDEDDEDESDQVERMSSGLIYSMADLALSDSSISTLASEKSEVQFTKRSPANSFATTVSEEGIAEQDFHQELSSSIFDSLQKGDDSTIIGLELQGLRLSSNASYHQVRRAIASAFTKRITQVMNDHNVMAGDAVPKVLRGYKKVFDNMVFDLDKAQKEDQVDFMLLMQKELTHQPKGDTILLHVSKELYSIEVIEEEAFDQWWANPQSSAEGDMERVRVQTKQFIEWLENAEEDGEDEESE